MRSVFFLMGCLLAVTACDTNRVFERNKEFEDRIWNIDSIPSFQFEIEERQEKYDITLNIRNTLTYPFQNIYITYFLEDTTGRVLKKDLVNYQLFDGKTGEPLGEGGLGDVYDHRFLLLDNYSFPGAGTYSVRLEQFMRRDSLPEIISVGIRVNQTN